MIEIIPAIDIIDGKCVRLTKGDYASAKIYNGNPVGITKHMKMQVASNCMLSIWMELNPIIS